MFDFRFTGVRLCAGALATIAVLALPLGAARAGHVFSENGLGDVPVALGTGDSFTMEVLALSADPSTVAATMGLVGYFSADWDTGDFLRITPDGGTAVDVFFDSGDPDFFFSRSLGFITDWYDGLAVGSTWDVEALTGSFTVEGIGMTLYNGTSVRGIAGSQFDILGAGTPPTDPPTDPPPTGAPEPATLALFGLGLAGLGLMRRRRGA